MKKFIVYIFSLILLNTLIYAEDINIAGFYGSADSFEFGKSTGYETDSEYLNGIRSVYSCPKVPEGQTMILKDINIRTGEIICHLYREGDKDPSQIFKIDASVSQKIIAEANALDRYTKSESFKSSGLTLRDRLGIYEFNGATQGWTTGYVNEINLSSLQSQNNEIVEFAKDTNSEINTKISIDSYTNSKTTLSNILAGLITLNPDFFSSSDLVKANGEIGLLDYGMFGEGNTSGKPAISDDGIFRKLMRNVASGLGANTSPVATDLSVTTIVGFLDKKFWGFYVYLMYNLKDAYIMILGSMMLFGAGFTLTKVGYGRIKSKMNKEEQEKIFSASKSLDVGLVIFLFLIPISLHNVKIPDQFLYKNSNQSIHTSTSTQDKNDLFTHSTLSSSSIRFFANLGSTWANAVSDYSFFAYLRYLESKHKTIVTSALVQNGDDIKKLYKDIFYLKKEYDYYVNVCRPAFDSVLTTTGGRFNSISKESKESFENNTISLNGTEIFDSLNYSKIDPYLCVRIEESVHVNTKKILGDYSSILFSLKMSKMIKDKNMEKGGDNSFKRDSAFSNYVNLMEFMQNNFGWINAVVVPTSYNLFFSANSNVFNYDITKNEVRNNGGNNISESWAGNDSTKRQISDEVGGGVLNTFIAGIQERFIWYIMPGFSDVHTQIYNFFSNVVELDPTARQSADGKKKTMFDTLLNLLTSFPGLGMIGGWLIKILGAWGGFAGSAILYGALLYASLAISIAIYTSMISTISMVVIATSIVVKIALYFMELLIYYFLSDAILFISMVTSKNEYFTKFLSKGLNIMLLSPILIVLSVYIYLLVHNLALELYKMLIGIIYEMIMVANETIIENNDTGAFKGIETTIAAVSLKSFGEIVVTLLSVIVGIVIIFNFKDWVFKIIGIDDDGISNKIGEQFNQKLTGGVNPIK